MWTNALYKQSKNFWVRHVATAASAATKLCSKTRFLSCVCRVLPVIGRAGAQLARVHRLPRHLCITGIVCAAWTTCSVARSVPTSTTRHLAELPALLPYGVWMQFASRGPELFHRDHILLRYDGRLLCGYGYERLQDSPLRPLYCEAKLASCVTTAEVSPVQPAAAGVCQLFVPLHSETRVRECVSHAYSEAAVGVTDSIYP